MLKSERSGSRTGDVSFSVLGTPILETERLAFETWKIRASWWENPPLQCQYDQASGPESPAASVGKALREARRYGMPRRRWSTSGRPPKTSAGWGESQR
jgi:hypothetical protein